MESRAHIPTEMLQTQGIFKVVEDGISQNIGPGCFVGVSKKKMTSAAAAGYRLGLPKILEDLEIAGNPWNPVRVKGSSLQMGGIVETPKGVAYDGTLGPHQNLVSPFQEGSRYIPGTL